MAVRGSVAPPASPLTKGPQPWSTSSKSSYTTVPFLVAGALLDDPDVVDPDLRGAAPAASIRSVVRPFAGAVKCTLTRWK